MNYIFIKFQVKGIHRWKDCPFEDVSFIKEYHRHIFFFEVKIEVFHGDRELEFIRIKHELEGYAKEILDRPVDYSCETIARLLLEKFEDKHGKGRWYDVLVLEDNENGGGISS